MNKLHPDIQHEVWKKTNGRCAYCGDYMLLPEAPGASAFVSLQFSIDHATPRFHGGTNDLSNLLPSCRGCNSAKRHKTVEQYREYLEWLDIGKFSATQVAWLQSHGIEIPKPPRIEFYFESVGLGSR